MVVRASKSCLAAPSVLLPILVVCIAAPQCQGVQHLGRTNETITQKYEMNESLRAESIPRCRTGFPAIPAAPFISVSNTDPFFCFCCTLILALRFSHVSYICKVPCWRPRTFFCRPGMCFGPILRSVIRLSEAVRMCSSVRSAYAVTWRPPAPCWMSPPRRESQQQQRAVKRPQ